MPGGQWLRLHAPKAGQGTRSHMSQLRPNTNICLILKSKVQSSIYDIPPFVGKRGRFIYTADPLTIQGYEL